jgi:uroporphyrin-III C-methyltransferase
MADALPELAPGSVWLVGAGPGDPGLLSWLAVHALRSADAVLHDRGIAPAVLELVGAASLEAVEGGRAALDRAIGLARDGWRVVRLLEGDPLSRRDGVVAALVLAEADIGFRIVPGITAGVAGLSYAGVPVTHREVNSAFTCLDLSEAAPGDLAEAASRLLGAAPAVVTGLDGADVGPLAETLLAAGVDPATLLLVVSHPTQADQAEVETTLGAAAAQPPHLAGKVVVALGANVKLRQRLAWRDRAARPRVAAGVLSFAGLAG